MSLGTLWVLGWPVSSILLVIPLISTGVGRFLLYQEWVLGVNFSSDSPVTGLSETVRVSSQLRLKEVKVSLFDWVNSFDNIPVHILGAWWVWNGSLIDPSVAGVYHLHEVAERNVRHDWVVLFSPLERVEEIVDNYLLIRGQDSTILINREENTNGSMGNTMLD